MPPKKKSSKKAKKSDSKKSKNSSKKKGKKGSENSKKSEIVSKEDKDKQEIKEYEAELNLLRKEFKIEEQKSLSEDMGGYTFEDEENLAKSGEGVELDYNQLADEVEKKSIKKNMAKCQVYLEQLGIEDLQVDAKNHIIIVPFEYEEFRFLSHIIVGVDWYIVKSSILELELLHENMRSEIFYELLKANFILNNVTYSVDPEGKSIWCEADIPCDVDFNHFKLEYLSIIFAIDYFINNITHDIKAPIKSTYPEQGSDNMYI